MKKLLIKRRNGTPANIKIGVFSYPTLRMAFSAINSGRHTGDIEIKICASTNEIASAVLNASGSGSASYTSVTIYPTVTGKKISGNLNTALIQLNGADNVIIDGRLNATGSTKDLIIENTNTGTAAKTIEFINGASSNTVKYCTIKGSSTNLNTATILIGTSPAAATGSSNNLIEYNDITKAGSNRALISLQSLGTSGKNNNENTVRYNNFFDCYTGIYLNFAIHLWLNTSSMTISNNSFYETTTVVATASGAVTTSIVIDNNINTTHTISNNYIGGDDAQCEGMWTKTTLNPVYAAIQVWANSGTVNITNNIIKNFDWSNVGNASWCGILTGQSISGTTTAAGVTASGNFIGDDSQSIKLTNTTTGGGLFGVNGNGTFSNNTINGLWTSNGATLATNVYGIWQRNAITANGNTITNLTANSASTGNAQSVVGIYGNSNTAFKVYDNTISNLTNNTTRATGDAIVGIRFTGSATLADNYTARNFIHGSFTTGGNSSTSHNVTGLKIVSGKATHYNNIISIGGNTQTYVYGIWDFGNTGNDQYIYFNTVYIHGTPSETADSTALLGQYNFNVRNYRNNLFINARSTNGTHWAARFEYNADIPIVYYGDTFPTGSAGQVAINSTDKLVYTHNGTDWGTGATGVINTRYTGYGTNFYVWSSSSWFILANSISSLTLDYNDYYISGTGGVLGYYEGANKTSLPIVPSNDANSLVLDPDFIGTMPSATDDDYAPQEVLLKDGTPVYATENDALDKDYNLVNRDNTAPTIGAFEI